LTVDKKYSSIILINKNKYLLTYQEWWRDRPYDTRQPIYIYI